MTEQVIGQRVIRVDGPAKVTGQAKYPQDFSMPGMLHAKVVWSEHPHAHILNIVTSQAEAVPGVVAVLTHKDVPVNEYGIYTPDQDVLAEGEVHSVGDPVALVIAETERAAEKARRLVQVEYEPLPVVTDPREAMKPDAPRVHLDRASNILKSYRVRKGDAARALAEADVVIEGTYHTPSVEHAYLQPEAGLGYIDDQGRVTVVAAAQWPFDDVHQIAHALGLPKDWVREIVPAIGGAFGGREDMSIQHLVALAAYKTGRPVKLVYSREESIRGHGKRHPYFMRYRTGATRDGRVTGMEIELVSDAGAYTSTSMVVMGVSVTVAAGPYEVENLSIVGTTVLTNNTFTMAMRGFGATQPPVAYETQMNKLAEALGMDPVEIRLKNLFREGSIGPTGTPMPPGVGIRETLIAAARAAGWREVDGHWVKPELPPPSAPHKRRGIGVACAYKNVAYSFGFDDKAGAEVTLKLDERGKIERVVVKIGACDVGEGVTTVLAQIAAQTLGVSLERIEVSMPDTAAVPDAGSTSASRQTFVSGNAVRLACEKARQSWREALAAKKGEREITAYHLFRTQDVRPTTPFDPETGFCWPHVSYGYATQIAEVEVDTETGEVEVVRLIAAHDVGRAINPAMIEGQIGGGVHMGLGFTLMERYIQEEGHIQTRDLTEYLIPTVLDMPRQIEPIIVEVPDPAGPFGAKGVGEMTTLPTAPAILAAIHDAVGVWMDELPATPEKVLAAIKAREREIHR